MIAASVAKYPSEMDPSFHISLTHNILVLVDFFRIYLFIYSKYRDT